MIHETLKNGGRIIETKGNNQELIVALMSAKFRIGDVFLFHTYLVVSRMKVTFGKVLSPTEFIQKLINYDMNGEFVLDSKFFEGTKINTHSTSTFLFDDHDNRGIIGDGTRMDNTRF
jgi:hypothetical protein